jgi:hypothetical protein
MANQELRDLYIYELKDLYNAENQLVKALPKLAKASSSEELRAGFEEHLEQTRDMSSGSNRYSKCSVRVQGARSAPAGRAWLRRAPWS